MSVREPNKTKQKKSINKTIVFVFLILFLLVLFQLAKRSAGKKTAPPPAPLNKTKQIEISGVSVNDFTDGRENTDGESYITLSRTKDYHVFYIPSQTTFFISVLSYPFDEIRPVAEGDFLDKLGITQDEACKLEVDISTPSFANPDKSGKTYDLSFCR